MKTAGNLLIFLVVALCIDKSWSSTRVSCVNVKGPSKYCGSDLPRKMCHYEVIDDEEITHYLEEPIVGQPKIDWEKVKHDRVESLPQGKNYNRTNHLELLSLKYRKSVCPASPESVPIPETREAYCAMDACDSEADCTADRFSSKRIVYCLSWCNECFLSSFSWCLERSDVVQSSESCISGKSYVEVVDSPPPFNFYALSALIIIIGVSILVWIAINQVNRVLKKKAIPSKNDEYEGEEMEVFSVK